MGLFDFLFGGDDSFDMTRDYIGKHGEFDRNDEERAICEDILSMKLDNPEVDLEEHFGWENKLNYDSERYADEESEF